MTGNARATFLSKTNENFYELAWGARAMAFFAKAEAEGKGSLYRTLKAFERLDRAHSLNVPLHKGIDTATQEPVEAFNSRVSFTVDPSAQPRPYQDILTATASALENRTPHETFAALDYDALPQQWLCEIARDGFGAVVELGAGYGRNLIEIYFRGGPANARYIGAEYTASGRALMDRFFKLEPERPFETFPFDHRQPDLSFLKGERKVLLFTRHSIEQVNRLPDDYFDVLAACAPEVVAVHFEPFGPQCPEKWSFSKTHQDYIDSRNFNLNLLETLRAAERRKRLNIRWFAPDVIDPARGNPTSVVLWDNRGA